MRKRSVQESDSVSRESSKGKGCFHTYFNMLRISLLWNKHAVKNTWVRSNPSHSAFIWTHDYIGIQFLQRAGGWKSTNYVNTAMQSGPRSQSSRWWSSQQPSLASWFPNSNLCCVLQARADNSGMKKVRIRLFSVNESRELSLTSLRPSSIIWRWKLPSGIKINTFWLG